VLTAAVVLRPSEALAKAAGAAGIISVGAFFALLGGLISTRWEHARGSAGVQPGDTGFRG
jgi:hypothetical protein